MGQCLESFLLRERRGRLCKMGNTKLHYVSLHSYAVWTSLYRVFVFSIALSHMRPNQWAFATLARTLAHSLRRNKTTRKHKHKHTLFPVMHLPKSECLALRKKNWPKRLFTNPIPLQKTPRHLTQCLEIRTPADAEEKAHTHTHTMSRSTLYPSNSSTTQRNDASFSSCPYPPSRASHSHPAE